MKIRNLNLTLFAILFLSIVPAVSAINNVTLKKGVLKLDGKPIRNWELKEFKALLGQPTRNNDGYNRTHTYDRMGVVLFEPYENEIPSGRVSEVQFYFSRPEEESNVMPQQAYTGAMMIDKLKVTPFLEFGSVRNILKDWETRSTYSDELLGFIYKKKVYIYITYNESKTAVKKLSIGLKKS